MSGISDKGTSRTCIFCGAAADSREHLLPCWLQRILPSDEPVMHVRRIGGGGEQEWSKRPFRERARFVCEACNGGWMSDLEGASRPILEPAILGQGAPFQLDLETQTTAARWAIKTCLVFQGTQGVAMAPRHHFEQVRSGMVPQMTVWVGAHAPARHDLLNHIYVQKPLSLEPLDDNLVKGSAFLSFLGIGWLCFLVIGHGYRNRLVLTWRKPVSDLFVKIWPTLGISVRFPPGLMMDASVIDTLLFERFEPPLLGVEVFPP